MMTIQFIDEIFEIDQIHQFEDIRYARSLSCQCKKATYTETYSYRIIGYADTHYGFMAVCECPECFEKYRHHIGMGSRYDLEAFKKDLGLILHLQKKHLTSDK